MATHYFCQDDKHEGPSRVHACKTPDGIVQYCANCHRRFCTTADGMHAVTCNNCLARGNNLAKVKEK